MQTLPIVITLPISKLYMMPSGQLLLCLLLIMSTSISTQIPNQKAAKRKTKNKKKTKSAVNNTVNKLILDRRSCEKLHKKLGKNIEGR